MSESVSRLRNISATDVYEESISFGPLDVTYAPHSAKCLQNSSKDKSKNLIDQKNAGKGRLSRSCERVATPLKKFELVPLPFKELESQDLNNIAGKVRSFSQTRIDEFFMRSGSTEWDKQGQLNSPLNRPLFRNETVADLSRSLNDSQEMTGELTVHTKELACQYSVKKKQKKKGKPKIIGGKHLTHAKPVKQSAKRSGKTFKCNQRDYELHNKYRSVSSGAYVNSGLTDESEDNNSPSGWSNNTEVSNKDAAEGLCSSALKSGPKMAQPTLELKRLQKQIEKEMAENNSSINSPEAEQSWRLMMLESQKVILQSLRNLTSEMESRKKENSDMLIQFNAAKADSSQVSKDLTVANGKIKSCEEEIEKLKKVVIRQDHELRECKNEIVQMHSTSMKNNIIIRGIVQTDKATVSCAQLVKEFFKNQLKIEEEVPVNEAFQLGKGKTPRSWWCLTTLKTKVKFSQMLRILRISLM